MNKIINKSKGSKLDFTIYNIEDAKVFIAVLQKNDLSIDFTDGRDVYRLYHSKKFYFYSVTSKHEPVKLSKKDAIDCVRNAHIDLLISGKLTEEVI